jgi:biopolymer transport protein ExbD
MHATAYGSGRKKARIEIIPLIDIMFFLLASFMLVSLDMVNAKSVKVSLPVAQTGSPENQPKTISISLDAAGGIFLDKDPIGKNELRVELTRRRALNPEVRVVISGDENARNGAMIGVLDRVRAAGIQSVAFQTREPEGALQ